VSPPPLRRGELRSLLLLGWLACGLTGGVTGGSFAWLLLADRAPLVACLSLDEVRGLMLHGRP
jgi:hypothetical protein